MLIIIDYDWLCLCQSWKSIKHTPFEKSNATRLWSIIFLLSWIFIPQVWYPWKACLFAFRLMAYMYLLGLFHWGTCRVSKLGVKSKRKSCKIYEIVWEMHAMSSFGLYARVPTAHSLRRNPPKLWCTERAVGTHSLCALCAFIHKRKGKTSPTCSMHFPYNPINFATFISGFCSQFTHPARAPVKQS